MKSRMIVSFMVIALAAALIGGATMAWFTDSEKAMEQTFTAGILDISTSNLELPTIDHMNPGDTFGPFEIEIVNEGNKRLFWVGDWGVSSSEEGEHDGLLDALYIKDLKMEMLDAKGNKWKNGEGWYGGHYIVKDGEPQLVNFDNGGDNRSEYNAYMNMVGAKLKDEDGKDAKTVDVISLRNFIDNGSMIPGSVFEHMGALKPGNKYKLTIVLGFLKEAGNYYQGDKAKPLNLVFNVHAMQVNEKAMDDFSSGLGNYYNWALEQLDNQPDNN